MNKCLIGLSALVLTACQGGAPLIGPSFPDSLAGVYSVVPLLRSNDKELRFWKDRIDSSRPGEINESRYASALVTRFRETGDIADLRLADDVYAGIDAVYRHRLAGPLLGKASTAMLQHRFSFADSLLQRAEKLGIEQYKANNISFDVLFELGRWQQAAFHLGALQHYKDYNYYFRKAKYEHLLGNMDSALVAISQAVQLTNSPVQKALALASEGDLLLHAGKFRTAADVLKQALRLNPADLHTLLGIGWIALIHDRDTLVAGKIFQLAAGRNALPDPLFKLFQMGQWRMDTLQETYYGRLFAERAIRPEYGKMYNKYLIELYTGILASPEKAERIAHDELLERATPQTYAWYAYALLCNNKKEAAFRVFQQHVSGRPLEAVELFYSGMVAMAAGRAYDARSYFDAALSSPADLSPAMMAVMRRVQ